MDKDKKTLIATLSVNRKKQPEAAAGKEEVLTLIQDIWMNEHNNKQYKLHSVNLL